jgi:uracil-DNA glycosylase
MPHAYIGKNNKMPQTIPSIFLDALKLAHSSWQPVLKDGLNAIAGVNPSYLPDLAKAHFLPSRGRIFAAFSQPLDAVRYVLVGEGPYPREESATGVCFMDGAVKELWSEKGLSKPVNRATSLRNFMKMLLVTEGHLSVEKTSGEAVANVAQRALHPENHFIQTLPELQENLTRHGFLLLNASLVFRSDVPPLKEGKAWQPFLQKVLCALADHADAASKASPTLVLWGKVAELLSSLPENKRFPKAISEHPYNLSFISNPVMQELFGPMRLLQKK